MKSVEINLDLWPRQLEAFKSEGTEILFGGASEGGKSHLVRVFLIAACLACKKIQCVLIRKKYADILSNHVEGSSGFRSLLAPLVERKLVKITDEGISFPHGSNIMFQHCQDERQFDSAQGVEKQILVIDEATQISERLIRFFRGWVRMTPDERAKQPKEWQNKLPCILYTANPIGPSVGFFRRNFVKARPHFEIETVEGFKRQYIPSRAEDNLSIDMEAHKGRMAGLGDAALSRALDTGDWDAPTGEYFPEWSEERHLTKEDFVPPRSFFRFRTFDWGTADPASVSWWAVSDGESFYVGDNEHWYPRGALICYREWYICDSENPSKGARMRNEDMARGILERSPKPEERNIVTLTDSFPFMDHGGMSIAEVFEREGVTLTKGDTSRVPGWSQLRDRLIGIQIDSNNPKRYPMIYFQPQCKFAREYIPALPRHPSETKSQDAAEHGEATHKCDEVRLACMAHRIIKDREVPQSSLIKREFAKRPTMGQIMAGRGSMI